MSDELKRCPYCSETIQAVAMKCRFCGEFLGSVRPSGEGPSLAAAAAPKCATPTASRQSRAASAVRRRWRPLALVAGTVLAVGAALWAVPRTDAWVRLHSDVEWHEAWQDAHREQEQERVAAVYAAMRDTHPGDAAYGYLAARALPEGAEQRAAFEALHREHPRHPWATWGWLGSRPPASTYERRTWVESAQGALQAFGDSVPVGVLDAVLREASRNIDWDALARVYAAHAGRISKSGELAQRMARVELVRGNPDGALAWERRAEALGHDAGGEVQSAVRGMRAVGFAPQAFRAMANGYSGNLRLAWFEAKPSDKGGWQVEATVRFEAYLDRVPELSARDFELSLASGGRAELLSLWLYQQVPGHAISRWTVYFRVPEGEEVGALGLRNGYVDRFGRAVVLRLPLGPEAGAGEVAGISPP